MTALDDAHNHLQDVRLVALRPHFASIATALPLRHAVVNGTRESDWDEVSQLADQHPWILPSFGLHPWHVKERRPDWLAILETALHRHPAAAVGEIGLDRWIPNPDMDAQVECFRAQLELAQRLQRPCTIHCLKAWGLLGEVLASVALPKAGFLLHSYGGPTEMVPLWVSLGAYFSISPYFAHERKWRQREVFRHIPIDRLLIETDAPDMWPPEESNRHPLRDPSGAPINHPANIEISLHLLAKERAMTPDELQEQLEINFSRLFLGVTPITPSR